MLETNTTVKSFLEEKWLPAIRVRIEPSTLDNYSSAMRRYVVPRIGGQQLGRVSPAMLMLCTQTFSRRVVMMVSTGSPRRR